MPAKKKERKKESKKNLRAFIIFAFTPLIMLILSTFFSSASNSLNIRSSRIYSSRLTGEETTINWGGHIGKISDSPVNVSALPFFSRYIDSSEIFYDELPGGNLESSKYNLLVMNADGSFNINLLYNTTPSDLAPGVLFPSSMYFGQDGPDKTFDCSTPITFQINGKNFSGCHALLPQNIEMGLLKYKIDSTHYIPVYILDPSDYICYNGAYCNFEFLLSVSNSNPYYYYYIAKFPQYKIKVWIDSIERTDFEQTALPYYLTVQVLNLYTDEPVSNIDVAVREENSNNIFVPLRLNGTVSRTLSIAKTDSNGFAKFIIAPTEYPTITNYSIDVGVLVGDEMTNKKELSVDNALSIIYEKKPLSPTTLLDNAKVAINAMNQIANSLYIWANSVAGSDSPTPEARLLAITVYTNGTYVGNDLTVQTGAPNVITLTLETPTHEIVSGYIKAHESNGYLIMNPTYNSTDTGYKQHLHDLFWIPTQHQFVITPTSYGVVNSSVKLDIYDENYAYITTINLPVNPNLEPRSGSYYENDDMKVIINSMAAVLNSLYYALN